ncbi:hypothetical protein DFJ74DRAFT_694863 [Hyaloraphidium curvatum]|nr:hypothetical protein DFJ74DRAFT_694863 [Hyaloraphidium curvatum]
MVLEDGRAVQVVADAAEPKPREGGPARIVRPGRASGVQALGEFAEPFEIEGARFEALEGEEEVKVKSEPGTEAEEQPAAPAPTPAAAPAPSRTSSAAPPPAPTPTAAPAPVPEVDELAGQLEALDIATPPAPLASSRLSEVAQMLDGLGGEQLAALGKFLDSLRDGVRRAEGKLAATQQQADNASVVQLLEMGFDHADAVAALARCGGDAGRAVEDLLSRGAE